MQGFVVGYYRLSEALKTIDPEVWARETAIPPPPVSPPAMKARDRLRHTHTLAAPFAEAGDPATIRQLIQTVQDLVQALGQRPRVIVKEIRRDADGRMTAITGTTTATLADPDPGRAASVT